MSRATRLIGASLAVYSIPPLTSCEAGAPPESQQDPGKGSADSAFSVVEVAQSAIQSVKDASGLPWWASIATTTALVRTAIFPLVPLGAAAAANLASAVPAFSKLNSLYVLEMRQIGLRSPENAGFQRLRALSLYVDAFQKIVKLYKVSFLRLLLAPTAQIGAMILFVMAMRRSVGAGAQGERPASSAEGIEDGKGKASAGQRILPEGTLPGMETGGILWFEDLTKEDESLRLPVAALVLTYVNLEMSFGAAAGEVLFLKYLKDFLQVGLIFVGPSVCTLPSGVFMYWITNGLWTAGQRALLRNTALFRSSLRAKK